MNNKIQLKSIKHHHVGQYSLWEGKSADDKTVCIFLANGALHIHIFKDLNDPGEIRHIIVGTNDLTTTEALEKADMEIV